MIPCFICKEDASTNWVLGFVPAPDSQKMALCALHATPANQAVVAKEWKKRLEAAIGTANTVTEGKTASLPQLLTVRFTGGGLLTYACSGSSVTEQGSLRVDELDGKHTFIPMQHIRTYTISPLSKPQASAAESE